MLNALDTVTEPPENGGTLARRKTPAIQLPTLVPLKLPLEMFTLVTRPLGAKVTTARPLPLGPSNRRQAVEADAAVCRAE
jgi:hypothetical protein